LVKLQKSASKLISGRHNLAPTEKVASKAKQNKGGTAKGTYEWPWTHLRGMYSQDKSSALKQCRNAHA